MLTNRWTPTRAAALQRLRDFVPLSGRYAAQRNLDDGPDAPLRVSGLSPWISAGLLDPEEIIAAVRERYAASTVQKLVQEVCWRSSFAGWLAHRPSVWAAASEPRAWPDPVSQRVAAATAGESGIAAFDAWAEELISTGYLHNHTRMWVASIWCHTLQLPWQAGAQWFLSHLLDGDPASNTCSWRWVAGLHTPGKSYVARAGNIARYTNQRVQVAADQLASQAAVIDGPNPKPQSPDLGISVAAVAADTRPAIVVVHPCAVDPSRLPGAESWSVRAIVAGVPSQVTAALGWSDSVRAWRQAAVSDGSQRAAACWGAPVEDATDPIVLAERVGAQRIIAIDPGVGPVRSWLHDKAASQSAISIQRVVRPWDQALWPLAKGGFFGFWKRAESVVEGWHRDRQTVLFAD